MTLERKIKQCKKCGKRFVENIGFHQAGNGYRSTCKICRKEKGKEVWQSKKPFLSKHRFGKEDKFGISTCINCNIERKRVAAKFAGSFKSLYRVDNKWVEKAYKCNHKQDKTVK